MPVTSGMFLFEVVIEKVTSLVESRCLIIKSDFADIFSLELRDPKQMYIVMPEPLPLPPEPPGKKKKPKKPKKPKKGKVKEEPPPPEPLIQSGQSVLFGCTAEFLIENMEKCPMQVSLWSKEDNLSFIGAVSIPWDNVFITFLRKVCNCEEPRSVTIRDEYNIFQEGAATMMAKVGIQVKLSFLNNKVTTTFRTLSEDAVIKKVLYTGMNSKTTSYMCTMKTTDEDFEENCNKIENQYIFDRPKKGNIVYADYKNAPGANLTMFKEGDYCCMNNADKPPTDLYKAPETCPDIDFIVDYVRKIVVSCNDQMRMLTPRPTIRPRIKATDIDRLCYCKETLWPPGEFSERFRREAQSGPCPLCIDAGKRPEGIRPATFDIANIRGPCGKADCNIARHLRAYIENLVEEDNVQINLDDIIGPCGSKECTLAKKMKEVIRHEGAFDHQDTLAGLSTQCACVEKMQRELTRNDDCVSSCSKDCESVTDEHCAGPSCPYDNPDVENVYNVYYFTVEYDFDKDKKTPSASTLRSPTTGPRTPTSGSGSATPGTGIPAPGTGTATPGTGTATPGTGTATPGTATSRTATSGTATPGTGSLTAGTGIPATGTDTGKEKEKQSDKKSEESVSSSSDSTSPVIKFPFCPQSCPSVKYTSGATCSKDACGYNRVEDTPPESKCTSPVCTSHQKFPPSPADSDIVIKFKDIYNPCCVKSCEVAEKVKEFIATNVTRNESRQKSREVDDKDPCYCDCVCTFKFMDKTTYCAVCGGYECLGSDVKDMPPFSRPHPCPVYHKLYDKKYLKTTSPWPEEENKDEAQKKDQNKKTTSKNLKASESTKSTTPAPVANETVKTKEKAQEKKKQTHSDNKADKKITGTATSEAPAPAPVKKVDLKLKYQYPAVPKGMGWNWKAEDIPGMQPHHKAWKPGAAHKVLVRRYRAMREGTDTMAKKKRALLKGKKKIEMKPTLVVSKRDGEFTVQMEVFKKYSKERLLYQYPYDEKPPQIYTIGKTAEEINKRQKQRDRKARRDTRRKCRLLQSTFRDRCQEICLKAYNQAIGLLPLPNPNNPDCPCMTNPDASPSPIIDSCSCSEEGTVSSSDTDNDEWVVEFTPPMARWDAKAKHPPTTADSETQFTYLDYKVKVLDKNGNQVPRFFKSHEGKMECSDLGGFWGPGHVWLEINKDGYIGPDERWVPSNFTGPDDVNYTAEEGFITTTTGEFLKIGIDGYIDKDLKWVYYPKKKLPKAPNSVRDGKQPNKGTGGKNESPCVTTPKDNKRAPEKVHGQKGGPHNGAGDKGGKEKDKKVVISSAQKANKAAGGKKQTVMSVTMNHDNRFRGNMRTKSRWDQNAIMHQRKFAKYCEIMDQLQLYDDMGESKMQTNYPAKTNRASNTPSKKNLRGLQELMSGSLIRDGSYDLSGPSTKVSFY